ncbi:MULTISPECIES: LacI family DNA-binding transcriptional regulator [Microbacterium]|jgi:DNA-binding LacI/PurR family transcriptional regulator|uniref:LacI family DNA-binding transcriptional regulator n=1 Tax=Microbacterium TaxID=33882 RepID=UPI00248E1D0D|nr:LacI family DNA-binding transcriptional regulator [Microbacterium aurum]MBZ6371147.1 LacI family transcriptional regulator [Microbacterium hominis]
MPTMQDVARHAGVSVMTVSNVINDHPHVRATTRQKVLESISALGYHVNTAARSLRQGKTGVIGLAVPDIDRPYFGMLARLLIDRAAAHGYELVIEQTHASREREVDAISRSRLRSYDGLFLYAAELRDDDAMLLRGEFPIVVFGEHAYSGPIDHVEMANADGARLATAHLIERGCRRVGILGGRIGDPDDIGVATLRTRGYREALEAAGIAFDPALVRDAEYSYEGGSAQAAALLAEVDDLDGLFCATDVIAIGAMRALHEAGRRVPQDVRVVGFDDVSLAAFTTPSLTSIAPGHDEMADAAMEMVLGRISGERAADDYRSFTGPARLVERESTASVV